MDLIATAKASASALWGDPVYGHGHLDMEWWTWSVAPGRTVDLVDDGSCVWFIAKDGSRRHDLYLSTRSGKDMVPLPTALTEIEAWWNASP